MRIIIMLLFLIFCLQNVNGQNHFEELKSSCENLINNGKYDTAILKAKEMLRWSLINETDSSLHFAESNRYLGYSFQLLNNNDSAIYFFKEGLTILKKQNRTNHLEYANLLSFLGKLYKINRDNKLAESYYLKSLEIRLNLLGKDNNVVANTLNNISNLYYQMGDFQNAEKYISQSLEIRMKILDKNHVDIGNGLYALGLINSIMGDFNSAEKNLKKSLEIQKLNFGEVNIFVAGTLDALGNLFNETYDFRASEFYYKQALDIYRRLLGENHLRYAGSLNNLGILYEHMGDYKIAESYYNNSLKIYKKIAGNNDPGYFATLDNLGDLYKKMGNYYLAESYCKQSMELNKSLGENHIQYGTSLMNLGSVYLEIGDYKLAEKYYKLALDIYQKVKGSEDQPEYANDLGNLGTLYSIVGNYQLSEFYLKKTRDIILRIYGSKHPIYAKTIENLGSIYQKMKSYDSSEIYLNLALEINKKVLGEFHPDISTNLENIGVVYSDRGNFNDAENYYNQALLIKKISLGENHPDYIALQSSLAFLMMKTNRKQEAYDSLQVLFKKKSKQIVDNFEWLDDDQKELYWKKEQGFFESLSWFAQNSHVNVPESVGLNYNSALITKSKLLESKISSENYYRDVDEIRDELTYRRKLLAKMESDGAVEKNKMDNLRYEADSLDKRLALSWPEYAEQKKNLSITWEQIQQNIEIGEAAIEFVKFYNEDDSLYHYNALLITKKDSLPKLLTLCKENELKNIQPKNGLSKYYSLIWQPLEVYLKDIKTIYYSPVGELNNIPLGALYASNDKEEKIQHSPSEKRGADVDDIQASASKDAVYLMDKYTLHQLTSTRYLALGLKKQAAVPITKSMLLAGGINYDFLPGVTNKADINTNFQVSPKQSRSSNSASGKLSFLPGSKIEIEQINNLLTPVSWNTIKLENNDATEENIIKYEGKEAKGIIHLATHGYAFPEYDFNDSTISKNSLRYSYRYSKNPMVRSGLILTGGNWAWTGSDTLSKLGVEQNGILTALEVSQLNLKKTKLVVLSACETGLGKIEGSEGTFGLKRAFKLAGVEEMIVSLWSVPDKETKELMGLFYTDLSSTLNPVMSFEKAQMAMRNKYPTQPQLWAGFVLVR